MSITLPEGVVTPFYTSGDSPDMSLILSFDGLDFAYTPEGGMNLSGFSLKNRIGFRSGSATPIGVAPGYSYENDGTVGLLFDDGDRGLSLVDHREDSVLSSVGNSYSVFFVVKPDRDPARSGGNMLLLGNSDSADQQFHFILITSDSGDTYRPFFRPNSSELQTVGTESFSRNEVACAWMSYDFDDGTVAVGTNNSGIATRTGIVDRSDISSFSLFGKSSSYISYYEGTGYIALGFKHKMYDSVSADPVNDYRLRVLEALALKYDFSL